MDEKQGKESNSIRISGEKNVIGGMAQGNRSRVDAQVNVTQTNTPANEYFRKLFDDLQARVNQIEDSVDQQMAQVAVDGLKAELEKGEAADESKLEKRIQAIRSILGDVFDVVVATIANPAAGFAVVAQKVAAKAQEQT